MVQRLGDLGRAAPNKSSSSRFKHIDALRAGAVLLVAVSHAGLGALVPGGAGVTIFFTISGFIITHILLKERKRTGAFAVREFYIKRLLKLAPPLFVIIVLPTIVFSFFARVDWPAVLGQVFFVYNWVRIAADASVLPGSGVTWSLAIEEQFYIGFSLFWIFASRTRFYVGILNTLAIAAIVWAVVSRFILVTVGASPYRIEFGTDTRLDSIAIGIICATIYFSSLEQSGLRSKLARLAGFAGRPWVFGIAAALFFAATAIPSDLFKETARYFLQSLSVGVVLMYGMQAPSDRFARSYFAICEMKLVQVVGLASYSIYLIHVPLYHLIDAVALGIDGPFLVAIKVLFSVTAGILVWRVLEVPIERYKARLFAKARP